MSPYGDGQLINETAAVLIGDVRSPGQGISLPPSSSLWGIWQLKYPYSREFAIQEKKMLMPGGRGQLELSDALVCILYSVYILYL